MKKLVILTASVTAFIFLLICYFVFIYFPVDKNKLSDIDISPDAITAKQVYACVNEVLEKYTPVRNMKLGEIEMYLDSHGLGMITLIYYEQNKKHPTLYYIDVDTNKHKLVSMEVVTYSEKKPQWIWNLKSG